MLEWHACIHGIRAGAQLGAQTIALNATSRNTHGRPIGERGEFHTCGGSATTPAAQHYGHDDVGIEASRTAVAVMPTLPVQRQL